MRIFLWHLHGSWTTAFIQGQHEYLIPVSPDRGSDGRGRARTYAWPESAAEVPLGELSNRDVDVVVLQRPHEVELVRTWLRRDPGRDVSAVYLEHNTPPGGFTTVHPMADQRAVPIVHVTHFNELIWDNGAAPTIVIDHGIIDPGHQYTGERAAAGVVVNEPVRRGRAVGTDLLPMLAEAVPIDVFGMGVDLLPEALSFPAGKCTPIPDLPQEEMHAQLAQRRVYVHTHRWTSLGLSLLEAMHLGMPVVVLGCTEAPMAVPPEAGCVTTDPARLYAAAARFLDDPDAAHAAGRVAREVARARYNLDRFLKDWDRVLHDAVDTGRHGSGHG
ncbi:glycosyltransferase [Phytoactinopolyspora alkaliphila]|uniref:Glycosyltransferase n=1 Tax=Phytoactinopolyspora alkaliphila TaxID=1783498 RepID=A0A6N9YLQ7_9ACTN|nr:glycosyltransferase [Phytoactinopolyspora alkaliphila]NED95933.1 glycosyltransferase [Phytoactinopolyspora alkaliphila]